MQKSYSKLHSLKCYKKKIILLPLRIGNNKMALNLLDFEFMGNRGWHGSAKVENSKTS